MNFATELIAKTPRSDCDKCGVKTIAVPWAEKGSRFTLMFEVIGACGNVTKAGGLLRLGWGAVESGLARREEESITCVGMDENSFRKGHFWSYKHAGNARKFFERWYGEVIGFGETVMVKVAEMLKTHLPNILTYFKHRITNAVSEGLNSKIQSIKAMARGFRGFENYRTRILFFCGKLDLSISPTTH